MARTRNIKPGFFKNYVLISKSMAARILFAGLWTMADKEGRLEDRPHQIKVEIFPGDAVDVDALLNELTTSPEGEEPFIVRYSVSGKKYIQILKFKEHQNPHQKEAASTIPAPELTETSPVITRQAPDEPSKVHGEPGLIPSPIHLVPHPEDAAATRATPEQRKRIEEITGWADDPNWMGNYSRFTAWIETGHDFELDILPGIRKGMASRKGKGPPRSLEYFDGPVADAKASRIKPMPKGTPNAANHQQPTGKSARARQALFADLGGEPAGPQPASGASPPVL